jgi:hypothetical protein
MEFATVLLMMGLVFEQGRWKRSVLDSIGLCTLVAQRYAV